MASEPGAFPFGRAQHNRRRTSAYAGRQVMSGKEIQAYLVARDVLRQLQRNSDGRWRVDTRSRS